MESQVAISCHQMQLPVPGLGYNQLNCLKYSYRNLQTTWAVAKTVSCCPQTETAAPVLETIPIQLIALGDVQLMSTHNLHSMS